ncbi:amidohydrolase family protein [Microcella humidisoli]|uniref:Amidohydrolase family protein n=1 Tax=Microcella humidisoli TaxID=2963406 RepID=A0ABY5FTF4_9MICO|nr:amidohydrolase family protein [Microcella humidisoli]UTT61569.1 amidohydrolase family protein [Microcella humidisoli]
MTPKAMDAPPATFRVADAWRGEWMGPSVFRRGGSTLHYVGPADADAAAIPLPGVLLPGFTDHHVHLQLLPADALEALAAGGLSRVIDLGGDPDALAVLAEPDPFAAALEFAGAFLTATGGYPSDRAWAPAGSWRAVSSADDAELAVAEQVAAGASRIKIALNADAGPVWDDALLAEVVAEIRAAGLPVVAHVEGAGQAARAIEAGVDVLAHAPFTEALTESLIAKAVAQGQRWVSTLAIHRPEDDRPVTTEEQVPATDRDIATANVRRFLAARGELLYGSDLGNGPQPLGVNPHELAALAEAGLDETAVLRALVGGFGRGRWKKRVTWMPARPSSITDLADAVSLSVGDLEAAGA